MSAILIRGFSRREKWTLIPPVAISLSAALMAPPPKTVVVNGQAVREMVINGYIVPKGLFVVVGSMIFGLMWWGTYRLSLGLWPDQRVFKFQSIYPRPEGGFVAWQPEVPGTPSPLDYVPPQFTSDTTAEEFLTAPPPHPMRAMVLGDAAMSEVFEFQDLCRQWLDQAPESTLKDFIPIAKKCLEDHPDGDWSHLIDSLLDASRMRGIPSHAELTDLAVQTQFTDLMEALDSSPAG